MSAFAGTWRLVKLALRRDRIKLTVWVVALAGLFWVMAAAVIETYSTEKERLTYAAASANSAMARAFNGPVTGSSAEHIVVAETFVFFTIFVALMSILAVVRHTRQNEENGCTELIGSAAVGRFAQLTAALLVAIGANVVLIFLSALALVGVGLPAEGAIATGVGMGMVGIVFAAITAVAAQLAQTARGAAGIAGAVLGTAFLIRAVGDAFGKPAADGVSAASSWPTWFSPIGWGQLVLPFTENNWYLVAVMALCAVTFSAIAFTLVVRRDMGAGMLPERSGRTRARRTLLSPLGLAWRLQRGLFVGWGVSLFILSTTFGAVAREVSSFLQDNAEATTIVTQLGGSENLVKAYFAFTIALFGVAIAAYAVQAILRLRTDESAGRLEPLLATATHRSSVVLSHLACVVLGAAGLLLIAGVGAGFVHGLLDGDVVKHTVSLGGAAIIQLPAVLLLAGFGLACFGLLGRAALATAWGGFAGVYLINQFGALLDIPAWLTNISPFTHTPMLPAEDITWQPLIIMTSVALSLMAVGLIAFRKRDVST